MYGMLKDIRFTEQLKAQGFNAAYCIAVTDDGAFYDNARSNSREKIAGCMIFFGKEMKFMVP